MNNQTMANQLKAFYLDWVNNYLTVEKMAEHNEITVADAQILINLGRSYNTVFKGTSTLTLDGLHNVKQL